MEGSFVVTGGARGIGRAVVEKLIVDGARSVVVLDATQPEREWPEAARAEGDGPRVVVVIGDAADEADAERAADAAEAVAPLAGWVNNAARFRDADLVPGGSGEFLERVTDNLAPVLAGCATAIGRFRAAGHGGAIVNLSSHQAGRAVRGAASYATAKAAIEGLTRALAVDHGPHGIRVNAVAPGSVETERYAEHLARLGEAGADAMRAELARLHPLGRVATAAEVAAAVAFLLSPAASFVSGVTLPVDGGRSVLGLDPEAR